MSNLREIRREFTDTGREKEKVREREREFEMTEEETLSLNKEWGEERRKQTAVRKRAAESKACENSAPFLVGL